MGWIASLFLKVFTGSTLQFVQGVLTSLTNEHTAIVQAQTGLAATEASAVVNAEIARNAALAQVQMAGMSHPVWWWGWALFVFPAGLYTAIIHLKSIFATFLPSVAAWDIPRIPAQLEAWDTTIILSFFGLATASSIVAAISNRLGKTG